MIAWIFRGYAEEMLKWVPVLNDVRETGCEKEGICIVFGVLAVLRVSFAMAVFHLFHALLMIGANRTNDCRISLNEGWWPIKVLLLFGLVVVSFFIPNGFFEVYGWIALIGSAFFVCIQLIYLVDFAHSVAEYFIGKMRNHDEEGMRNPFFWLLLGGSIVLYLFAAGITVMEYAVFAKDAADCQMNVWFITINVMACFVISVMSIHPKIQEMNEDSSILQASVVSAYCSYLILSSMLSEPEDYSDGKCNPWSTSNSASQSTIALGAVFTIVVVVYSTFQAAHKVGKDANGEQRPLMAAGEDKDEEDEDASKVVEETEAPPYNITILHLFFMLASMYIGMLLSDWSIVDVQGASYAAVDTGYAAVWVKAVSSWVCIGLYTWSLVAPVLFPDRDFSRN
jgi:hypothetical protein